MDAPSNGLRKGAWTAEEDCLLRQCIDMHGEGKWHLVPSRSGLNRCRKSCRLRWLNYLKPSIKRGKFSSDEVDLLSRLHKLLGNRWSLIAGRLPGRTANDVKNYWNTHLSKKSYLPCKTEMKEGNSSSSAAIPASNADVRKPQPRSFSNNNSLSSINCLPEVDIDDNNITCTKDKEKYELVENLMDGDNMWWESLLKDNGGANTVDSTAMATDEAGTSLMNTSSFMFDIDKLWSLFNEETMEVD